MSIQLETPESSFTLGNLITDVLTDECSSSTNISFRYSNNVNEVANNNSFGYFTYTPPVGQVANDSNFPFTEGIVLSTGHSVTSEGPNNAASTTGIGGDTIDQDGVFDADNWLGDDDLKQILDVRLGDQQQTNNATIIEFDFVPITDSMEFDYIFASEEWNNANYECPVSTFQDGFAFIITGPGIIPDTFDHDNNPGTPEIQYNHGGKNIALLRENGNGNLILDADGKPIPVSVGTIYNNTACNPNTSNEEFHINYTGGAATTSPLQFNARTIKLTARETVQPGQTYHLKFVIADRGDGDESLDSAVFLAANSFTTAPVLTINGVEVGDVQPVCQGGGQSVTIDGTMNIPGLAVTYQWYFQAPGTSTFVEMTTANGFAQNEDGPQLTTNITGTYQLIATLPIDGSPCNTQDTATITFLPDTTIGPLQTMQACDSGDGTANFTLTNNDTDYLNGQDPALYSVTYHANQTDADSGNNPLTSPYNSASGTIYARTFLTADATFCYATEELNLVVNTVPTANITTAPAEIRICDVITATNLANQETFDLTTFNSEIEDGQTDITISYHLSQDDANNNVNALTSPYTNTVENPEEIFVRVENNNNTSCYATTSFNLIVDITPVVQPAPEIRQCDIDPLGEETFDLTVQNTTVLGTLSAADFTVSYHYVDNTGVNVSITDPSSHILNAPALSQEIFITITNNANNSCTGMGSFMIYRDPIYTTAANPDDLNLVACDDNTPGDLQEIFNLSDLIPNILGAGVTTAQATVSFFASQDDLNNNIPIVNPNSYNSGSTTIYYNIVNNDNNTCSSDGTFTLTVHPLPILPTNLDPYKECDTDLIDGIATFDNFSTQTELIVNGNTNYAVTYHLTFTDAQNNTNEITNGYQNTTSPNNQTIGVRITDVTTGCSNFTTIDLEVISAPQAFPIPNPYIIL